MGLIERQLGEVWDALRAQGARRADALEGVRIRRLRGIADLRVRFPYPVCVLAGPNGCGKSTVLFACAAAYRDPERGPRELTPSTLFPDFASRNEEQLSDSRHMTELEYDYLHAGSSYGMVWRRGKSWNRSFMGRKGGSQPERRVYLRTLTSLSEARSLLQLARKAFETIVLPADLLVFAHRILPRRYRNLSLISERTRELLFAETDDDASARYSEFHMSAGERAVLRLSKDLSSLDGALVLIDEIEAGLHPHTQQQTLLELQRTALRQDIQIIVASHSPVVIDCVPPEARLFLDRNFATGEAQIVPALRDVLQKALYGQSLDRLSILCEDAVSEAVVLGVLDVINPEMGLRHDDFVIGRDTGSTEYPGHVRTLGKFDRLGDFLFVLDGDARDGEGRIRQAADSTGGNVRCLFLPGSASPEQWIWKALQARPAEYAPRLGLGAPDLADMLQRTERMLEGAVRSPPGLAKSALSALAEELSRTVEEVARIVSRTEAAERRGDMARVVAEMREHVESWRRTAR